MAAVHKLDMKKTLKRHKTSRLIGMIIMIPFIGALLWLGYSYDQAGRTLAAWLLYIGAPLIYVLYALKPGSTRLKNWENFSISVAEGRLTGRDTNGKEIDLHKDDILKIYIEATADIVIQGPGHHDKITIPYEVNDRAELLVALAGLKKVEGAATGPDKQG